MYSSKTQIIRYAHNVSSLVYSLVWFNEKKSHSKSNLITWEHFFQKEAWSLFVLESKIEWPDPDNYLNDKNRWFRGLITIENRKNYPSAKN